MNQAEYYKKKYYGTGAACPASLSADILRPYLKGNVLEVGCGQGTMVKELSKGMRIYGCDVFHRVEKLGKNFFVHNMEEKPTQKKFDSIYCLHVLEHIFDYISFLQNVRNSLKPAGALFIAVPNSYSLLSRIKFFLGNEGITMGVGWKGCIENNSLEPHIRFFGKSSLRRILEKNGFMVKEAFGTTGGKRSMLGMLAGQLNFVCEKK